MQQNQHLRKTAHNLDTMQGHWSVHLDNTNSDVDISHAPKRCNVPEPGYPSSLTSQGWRGHTTDYISSAKQQGLCQGLGLQAEFSIIPKTLVICFKQIHGQVLNFPSCGSPQTSSPWHPNLSSFPIPPSPPCIWQSHAACTRPQPPSKGTRGISYNIRGVVFGTLLWKTSWINPFIMLQNGKGRWLNNSVSFSPTIPCGFLLAGSQEGGASIDIRRKAELGSMLFPSVPTPHVYPIIISNPETWRLP